MPSSLPTLSARETTLGDRDLGHWRTPPGRWLATRAHHAENRLGPRTALLLTLLLGLAVLAFGIWASGEIYSAVQQKNGLSLLDQPTLDAVRTHRTRDLNRVAVGFTETGGPIGMPILATLVAAVLSWRWRSWSPVALLVIGAAGSLTATIVGKRELGRLRPPLMDAVPPYEYSPSFPSGHSLNSIVIGGLVAYLLMVHLRCRGARWAVGVLAVLYAVAMGASRVYLGHHWVSDVLFAWALGLAWLAVVITTHRLIVTAYQRRHPELRKDQGRGVNPSEA